MDAGEGLIELERITKRFGGLTALDGVGFEIRRGEVHAVLGENGAGKSTLMKILAGVHAPDGGVVRLRGRPVSLSTPRDARRHGISIVFQELNLFPHLTVAGNIFANREISNRFGLLDEREMSSRSRAVLDSMGVTIDPRARVGTLAVGERQLVEIARTLAQESSLIILDEPNSALTEQESRRLFDIIRKLRDRGVTILYVSHRLEEVFAVADRITVLRDGKWQGTWRVSDTSIPEVVHAMIGRRIEETFPELAAVPADAPVLLEARDMARRPRLGPVSFHVRAGEILGFAGLEGSGIDELFQAAFGLDPRSRGEVIAGGAARSPGPVRSAPEAIRRGLGLIPRSRREEGLFTSWSISRNATLVILDRLLRRLGLIDGAAERRTAEEQVARLRIATDSVQKRVSELSGGNQQKVVLAKWLASDPKVLLLNDPTRGVDVGAKAEIYQLCRDLAARGLAILFTSSEIEETLGLSHRVLAMRKGKVARELLRGEASKAEVLQIVAGG
jgi:ABC-type sugar transport system ATPase subunit